MLEPSVIWQNRFVVGPFNKIKFQWLKFSELTQAQLYAALALRCEVFIVEQQCPYLDPDGKDFDAIHLLGMKNNKLVAYLRLFPPNLSQDCITIGRVVIKGSARGQGTQIMRELLDYCTKHYPHTVLYGSAQLYLKKFYERYGFQAEGEVYDEDGILHVAMKKYVD